MFWFMVGVCVGWLIPMPQVLRDAAADVADRTPIIKNLMKLFK